MKYILLMTGAKAGVDAYRAWSEKDIEAHFALLKGLNKELNESGEFVANEGLARAGTGQGGARREGRHASHRWSLPRSKGVSSRLLDGRCR